MNWLSEWERELCLKWNYQNNNNAASIWLCILTEYANTSKFQSSVTLMAATSPKKKRMKWTKKRITDLAWMRVMIKTTKTNSIQMNLFHSSMRKHHIVFVCRDTSYTDAQPFIFNHTVFFSPFANRFHIRHQTRCAFLAILQQFFSVSSEINRDLLRLKRYFWWCCVYY